MKRAHFPEALSIRLPNGYLEKIDLAAADAGMSPPEWVRHVIRRALDADRKKRARNTG